MSPLRLPLQMLLLMCAGWVDRRQLEVIKYLQEENRLLKERDRALNWVPAATDPASSRARISGNRGPICV